jgi:hypothetical protein
LRFWVSGLALLGELHPRAGNGGSVWIDDCSVDTSRNWWVRKLLAC